MKMEEISGKRWHRKAFIISIALGLLVWFLDALLDYLFFYQNHPGFTALLITDVPPHELYIRSCALILFILFGFIISSVLKQYERSDTRYRNIFNNVIPICITDNYFSIISANKSYQEIFGRTANALGQLKCYDSRPGSRCRTEACPLVQIRNEGKSFYTCEATKEEKDGNKRYFIVSATPYLDNENNRIGIIETFQDITPRRLLEEEREKLIASLRESRDQVKTLRGFLPICSSCKKIRDDKGYWNQIESYIKEHSEAEFSHSICPACAEKLYGEYLQIIDHREQD